MEEESVYQLIKQSESMAAHPPMYRSKFNASVPPSYSTFGFQGTSKVLGNVAGIPEEEAELTHPRKKPAGTFGRSVGPMVNPKQFLKKTQPKAASTQEFHRHEESRKPGVPTRDEKPVMGLTTDKNFVVANAVENILAVPKKQTEQPPRAVEKHTYGKVPRYITKIKSELHASYTEADEKAKQEEMRKSRVAGGKELLEVEAAEAQQLREGLQARWDQLNKQFSTMSFNLETRSQLKRKEVLETELRSIEKALQRLNKPRVFVYDE